MQFRVITKPGCSFCDQAKALLTMKGHTYSEDLRETTEEINSFIEAGYRSFPQVFLGENLVGNFQQLRVYLAGLTDDDF